MKLKHKLRVLRTVEKVILLTETSGLITEKAQKRGDASAESVGATLPAEGRAGRETVQPGTSSLGVPILIGKPLAETR
jgi:hypothetical protein